MTHGAGPSARSACRLLLVLALLHGGLGVFLGATDGGDYGLVLVATPMIALTALAGFATLSSGRWSESAPVCLTSISLGLSVALIGIYGIGWFHLPQSVLALTVTLARGSR